MKRLLPLVALAALAAGCSRNPGPDPVQIGGDPQLPDPHRGLLPTMKIADPAPYPPTASPTASPRLSGNHLAITGMGVA